MQRRKGAAGELEVAKLFISNGYDARRGGMGQSQGASITPDVVVETLPFLWIEVKRQAQTRPLEAIEQADKALTDNKYQQYKAAVCFTRNNGEKWAVWTRIVDLVTLSVIEPSKLHGSVAINMSTIEFFNLLKAQYAPTQNDFFK